MPRWGIAEIILYKTCLVASTFVLRNRIKIMIRFGIVNKK